MIKYFQPTALQNLLCIFTSLVFGSVILLTGCNDTKQDSIFQRLDLEAQINTFPLTIVFTDRLTGNSFPPEIQQLCGLCKYKCKSLPMAGLLRLGPDQYYPYNNISLLQLPGTVKNNETAITDLVDQQVTAYLSTATLRNFDSLRSVNNPDWNIKSMASVYINKTADSIFFFSSNSDAGSAIELDGIQYPVFNDAHALRNKINEVVCKGHGTVSVFFNPSFYGSSITTASTSKWPARGVAAGDTCLNHAKYVKLHDGKGGFITGKLIEANSVDCGFTYPTGIAGDTCVGSSKYHKMHNGKGGFAVGTLIERDSRSCGFTPPPAKVITPAIKSIPPPAAKVTPPVKSTSPQVKTTLPPVKNTPPAAKVTPPQVKSIPPAPEKGTLATGSITYKGLKYERLNDGKGGYMRGKEMEIKSKVFNQVYSNSKCVKTSEPLCEKDSNGNYTGRRVQYCYNAFGLIIRTIVIAKCDSGCRCLGL